MSRRLQENIFAGILFLLFLTMLVMSFNYGPRARLVPVPIAIVCMVLIAIQIVMQNVRATQDLSVDALELISGKSTKAAKEQTKEAQKKALVQENEDKSQTAWERFSRTEFAALGIILIFLGLFLTVGPIPAVFLFSAGYFMFSGHWSPLRSIINGAICAAILYVTFGAILGVQLNRGLLAPYISTIVHF